MSQSILMQSKEMKVVKRNGTVELVSFDKILKRVKTFGLHKNINHTALVIKVIEQLYDLIKTTEIDELTAEQCASMSTIHTDYGNLACKIIISNHHKNTSDNFAHVMKELYEYVYNDIPTPLISKELYELSQKYETEFNKMLKYDRDYFIDYFGFKTLERAYLFRTNGVILERPQHMFLRVSIGIHGDDLKAIKETYDLMSQKYFIHATPTLFNSGTDRPQNSSCYLLMMEDDSIDGIYNTLKSCAKISKYAGGIGLNIHNIRASKSIIRGTSGISNGIIPMLRVYNESARYVDQGGGKRKGSFAIYLEPWHGDIMEFIDLRKNHGDEDSRCRDLFLALWIPDLFMERMEKNGKWSLFCPDKCKGLQDVYGDEFNKLYEKYEKEGKAIKTIDARYLWTKILDSQIETGGPYMLYKDSCNKKSNQQNLGTIKSSNLCTEIIEYSSKDETAVCNLASIGLSKFIKNKKLPIFSNLIVYTKQNCQFCELTKWLLNKNNIEYKLIDLSKDEERFAVYEELSRLYSKEVNTMPQLLDDNGLIGGYTDIKLLLKKEFDYEKLHSVTKVITNNLNKIIDVNFYPTEQTRRSNYLHRPIGIGVQGLADIFCLLEIPFESEEAKELNKNIFETIYHAALEKSMELSKDRKKKMQEIKKMDNLIFTTEEPHCRTYVETNDTLNELNPIRNELLLDDKVCGSYSSFMGSPASNGIFQFDMWGVNPSDRYNWSKLKKNVMEHGLRNSLLVAPMPTASTSQILGNNECFEPFTSNIYTRRTLAGDFLMVNKYLIEDMTLLGMWNENIKDNIILNKGSIQQLTDVPKFIKQKYKIVWEIPMKHIIDMSKDRGAYICQSQSLNLWQEDPTHKILTNMHLYTYKAGLKTGLYYLRRKPKYQPQQFTIEPTKKATVSSDEEHVCEMCSG